MNRVVHHRNFFPAVCAVVFVVWVNGWLLPVLAVAGVAYLVWSSYKRLEQKRAADAAWIARADWQHARTLAGDERGVYGDGFGAMQEFRQRCPTSPE